MTTAVPGPTRSTNPSPCPTSQTTSSQSPGGQPKDPTGRRTTSASSRTARTIAIGRARILCNPTTSTRQSRVSTATPTTVAGQALAAPGRSAPSCAMRMIHRAGHPASHPASRAKSALSSATPAAPKPRIVAGPTAGPASRLAPTATSETSPDNHATTGVHAICAASGQEIASANRTGIHTASASRHPGPSSTIPAVASTDRAKPADRASDVSSNSSAITAKERLRTARRFPPPPVMAASATRPIAAARSTLGCGRASTTNTTTITSPTTVKPRARTPSSLASGRTKARSSVRLVPDTADKCVSPVTLKSSTRSGGRADSSPMTSAGTSPRTASGSPATDSRRPARTRSAARSHHAGSSNALGAALADSIAATSDPPSTAPRRPLASTC